MQLLPKGNITRTITRCHKYHLHHHNNSSSSNISISINIINTFLVLMVAYHRGRLYQWE